MCDLQVSWECIYHLMVVRSCRTPIPGNDEGLYGQNPKDYTGENPDISSQFCYRLSGSDYSRNILWKHRVYIFYSGYIYIYSTVYIYNIVYNVSIHD